MALSLLRSGDSSPARLNKAHFLRLPQHSCHSSPLSTSAKFPIQTPTGRFFSQSSAMSSAYFSAVKARRTIYTLKKESTIDDKKIEEIVSETILHAPSSFNSQSTRVVILLKEEHNKLWDIAKDALKAVVSAEQYDATEQKLNMFQGAYGTILFFVTKSVVKGMQDKFPLYADKFPVWAAHSDGMAQHITWTALEAEGLGANLQHYNPLIDAGIQKTWNVPEDWELSAQLVFGTPTAPAAEKTFSELSDRLKVYGA